MKRRLHARLTWRGLFDLTTLVVTILLAWFLWPASLGGSTRFIVVAGHSMEPTYHQGELVVLDTAAEFGVGDIVVFQIPAGQPGAGYMIIHRVIDIRDDGTYITQGDNRDTPDSFTIRHDDILGTPRVALPYFGLVVGLFRTPMGVGVAAGVVCTLLMWPRPKPPRLTMLAGFDIDDEGWSSVKISDEAKMEADAWLKTELQRDQVPYGSTFAA